MFHFYTPWKHQKTSSENLRGYRSGTLVENGLRLDLSQLKLEYLNHLHSELWYKSNTLTACSVAQAKQMLQMKQNEFRK